MRPRLSAVHIHSVNHLKPSLSKLSNSLLAREGIAIDTATLADRVGAVTRGREGLGHAPSRQRLADGPVEGGTIYAPIAAGGPGESGEGIIRR